MTLASVEEARAAFEAQEWAVVREWRNAESFPTGDPEANDLVAWAAWWLGEIDDTIAYGERAYRLFVDAGDDRAAGRLAHDLSEHHALQGRDAVGGSWFRRAERHLQGVEPCLETAMLDISRVHMAHGRGDMAGALALAHDVVALGRTLGEPDAEALGMQAVGRLLLEQGQIEEGLIHLDDAMLPAVEGRLSAFATGSVYCSMISACMEVGDLRRATEWTDAASLWAERQPPAAFPGLCQIHRAEILYQRGECARAIEEAEQASQRLAAVSVAHTAAALYALGDARRRLGDLDGAEEAFRQVHEMGGRLQPGLALLRLAQGQADQAAEMVRRTLDDAGDGRPNRIPLLAAQVQIDIARNDLDAATRAADCLDQEASQFGSGGFAAIAATARGRLLVALGDAGAATAVAGEAVRQWRALDCPYEVATALVLLGRALRAAGDEDGAEQSLRSAAAAFEELGACPEIHLPAEVGSADVLPDGLTEREVEVLGLAAKGMTNKEIAAELYLSQKTIARHLSNIFTKIGVGSRAAATAYAFEHSLVDRS